MNDKAISTNKKILILNPTLEVEAPFIDSPAFNFVPPLLVYNTLISKNFDVTFIDSYKSNKIVGYGNQQNKKTILGDQEYLDDKLEEFFKTSHADLVLVHTSTFHRAVGLENEKVKNLVEKLALLIGKNTSIILADMFDSSTHYLSYNIDNLKEIYQPLCENTLDVWPRFFPYEKFGLSSREITPPSVEQYLDYRDWLEMSSHHELIKDCQAGEIVLPFTSSFGCPYNCSFCKTSPDEWIDFSLDMIKEQWSILQDSFDKIFITDPYSNKDEKRFSLLLQAAIDLNLKLHFTNGIGLRYINEDIASKLSKCVSSLYISPESLLEKSLKYMHKPISLKNIYKKIKILSSHKVNMLAHFITKVPGESLEDQNTFFQLLADFCEKYNVIPHVQMYNDVNKLHITKKMTNNIFKDFFVQSSNDLFTLQAIENLKLKLAHSDHRKIIINITYKCNNRCTFCATGDRTRIDGDPKIQKQWILDSYDKGVRHLDIDGGEPTLDSSLFELLDTAKSYERVSITSNGRRFADEKYIKKFNSYENLSFLISLHSSRKDIENFLVRAEAGHTETSQGILNVLKFFPNRLGVNTTITSVNYPYLVDMAQYLVHLKVPVWNLQWYTPFGVVSEALAPPDEAISIIRAVINQFKLQIKINLVNFIYCQAPDLASHMALDYYKSVREMMFGDHEIVNLANFLGDRRYKIEKCKSCAYNNICKGFWDYKKFDESEHVYLTKGAVKVAEDKWQEPVNLHKKKFLSDLDLETIEKEINFTKTEDDRKVIKLLDIIPGYACNRKCEYCTATDDMRQVNSSFEQLENSIKSSLTRFKPLKARIGGGEPTIRSDLFSIINLLSKQNISEIAIQTNGLMLAYAGFTRKLIKAGVTQFNISFSTLDNEDAEKINNIILTENSLSTQGGSGGFTLQKQGLANALATAARVELDILPNKKTIKNLQYYIDELYTSAVAQVNFWFMANEGKAKDSYLVPEINLYAKNLNLLIENNPHIPIKSYYLPACYLVRNSESEELAKEKYLWHPADEDAYVITPENSFKLDAGEIDLGVKTKDCEGCSLSNRCIGVRSSYIAQLAMPKVFPKITP